MYDSSSSNLRLILSSYVRHQIKSKTFMYIWRRRTDVRKKGSRVTYFKCEVDVSFSLRTAASAYEKRLDVSAILTIAFQEKRMNKSTGREKSLRTHKRRDNEISKNITILLGQGTHTAETC